MFKLRTARFLLKLYFIDWQLAVYQIIQRQQTSPDKDLDLQVRHDHLSYKESLIES